MADYDYIDTTGVIVADTADVLATVQGEWKTVFGDDLVVTSDTPQGKMIVAETANRVAVIKNNAAVSNQINPNLAGSVFLDAILALLGQTRTSETFTIVPACAVAGQPQTIIPAGTQARDNLGNLYATAVQIQLDNTGNGLVDFVSVVGGPVPCAIGALTGVVSAVLGWETVTNANAGIPGVALQQDAPARVQRNRTLGTQAISEVEAITSALWAVPGVTSVSFRENTTGATAVIDGITLVRNSVWACVDGGADADVATALLENKTGGAAWNGATSVPTKEPASGQTYPVLFDRPTYIPLMAVVTLRQGTSTADLTTAVPTALADWAAGVLVVDDSDGTQTVFDGLQNGIPASPFEMAGAVIAALPGVTIKTVTIATIAAGSGALAPAEIPVALNQRARLTATSVQVIITT